MGGAYGQREPSIGGYDNLSQQQFKQNTTTAGDSNPSLKQAGYPASSGRDVSQFSYATTSMPGSSSAQQQVQSDSELPGTSTTVTPQYSKYSYPPSESQIQNLPPNEQYRKQHQQM